MRLGLCLLLSLLCHGTVAVPIESVPSEIHDAKKDVAAENVNLVATTEKKMPDHIGIGKYKGTDSTPRVTVMLMSYYNEAREGSLRKAVEHYVAMDQVMDMVVLWNSKEVPVPDLPNSYKIRVFVEPQNSLNNRWMFKDFKSAAGPVLIVDDDELMSPDAVDCYVHHHVQNPRRLIGYRIRGLTSDGRYSSALDVGSFVEPPWMVHKDLFKLYGGDEYSKLRKYVDEQDAHCDDTLMNRVMYEHNNIAPLSLYIPEGDLQILEKAGGLTNQDNRRELRAECTKHIQADMKSVPQVVKASEIC